MRNISLAFLHAVIMPLSLVFLMLIINKNYVVFLPITYLAFMSAIYSIRAKMFPIKSYIKRSNEFFSFVGIGLKLIICVAIAAILIIAK